MALNVADIRSELNLPVQVLADDSISSILIKVSTTDLNLVCAECLRFVLRSYRGRVRYKIGSFSETLDSNDLRSQINVYMHRTTATEVEHTVADDTDDPNYFKRDGL